MTEAMFTKLRMSAAFDVRQRCRRISDRVYLRLDSAIDCTVHRVYDVSLAAV